MKSISLLYRDSLRIPYLILHQRRQRIHYCF